MPVERRPIPTLRGCPRARSMPGIVSRSYPVGRQEYSRAFSERPLELTVTIDDACPGDVHATLATTINAHRQGDWIEIPFTRDGNDSFVCKIVPERPGLFWFRAHFALDHGATRCPDAVQDAWVLVDPPQVDDLRLYTLIPTVSGTIADWTRDLIHIKEMGFNAVHLLPITALDDSQSPYAAHDLFEIDRSYLTPGDPADGMTQLERFVEEAKRLELRLCFDLVLNHIGEHSTMARRSPEWIAPDPGSKDGLKRARYWSDHGWEYWNDLVLINFEHPSEEVRSEIWAYMTEYALFWSKYADYTGGFVRFDNLHGSDQDFVRSVSARLSAEYPKLAVIAEYFTDEVTLLESVPLWRLNLVLATPWGYRFVPQLRDYLKYIHRLSEHVRYFMPISSHDSGTPAQEFATSLSTIPRYVAAALLGTGATGITQGVEWGEPAKIDFIGRHGRRERPAESVYAPFIRQINEIMTEHPAFRRGGNCRFIDGDHSAIIAAFRSDTKGAGFLVICNFDIESPQTFETDLSPVLGAAETADCQDLLTGEERSFPGGRLTMVLPPCSAQVLKF